MHMYPQILIKNFETFRLFYDFKMRLQLTSNSLIEQSEILGTIKTFESKNIKTLNKTQQCSNKSTTLAI